MSSSPADNAATVRSVLSWEAPFADPSQWGGRRAEANEALAALLAQVEAAEELRSQFERHVESMIEPKLLERAKQAEARVTELERMVYEHHQSLAAIGGGPCICDICESARLAVDPVCLPHGMRWSEHEFGRCLYCEICFKALTPDECVTDTNGERWNICPGQCSVEAGIVPPAGDSGNTKEGR